jgi:hypothetical protein
MIDAGDILDGGAVVDRDQALKTLRLDGSADGRTVESQYWNLVRQAQERAAHEPGCEVEIDRLNAAYGTLAPDAHQRSARPAQQAAASSGVEWLDWIADWVSAEALRTRGRWAGRNPEIALIGGGAAVLMLLAVGAGAPLAATFLAAGLVCAAIWSPWRRPK